MTTDAQDVNNTTLDPSASQAANQAPPAESTAPPAAPAEPPKPADKPDFREALAADMVKGAFDDAPAAPAAPAPPKEPEKPAAESAPPTPAAPADDPYDDPDDPKVDDIDPRLTKIRSGFEKFRGRLREARKDGQFGRLLAETARRAGVTPDQLAHWVHLGARLNQGDPAAVAEMSAFVQRLGIQPPAAQPPATPPTAPPPPAAPTVDDLAEKVYREEYEGEVKRMEMSEEAARRLARKQAARMASAAAPPSPPPAPPAALSQPPTAPPPREPPADPLVAAAVQELNTLDAQYAKSVPGFEDIRKEVLSIIADERAKSGPIPPMRWPVRFTEVVRQVQARRAAAATPVQRVPPESGLRPSTGAPPPASKNRDEHLSRIADAVVAGDESLLPS